MKLSFKLLAAAVGIAAAGALSAAEVHVAVAANFTEPAKVLKPMFEKLTGDTLVLSFSSTGKFYGQIKEGATYDVLLAADAKTPKKAVAEGYGLASSVFTYAVGKLVLWSSDEAKIKDGAALLKSGKFNKCAVANPKLAPYGLAAYETLEKLNLLDQVKPKFVEGDTIGNTFSFVKTGNAEIGFVALSQVWKNDKLTSGSAWIVPEDLHNKIAQDAVLLKQGKNPAGGAAFLKFLKSPEANAVKASFGYGEK